MLFFFNDTAPTEIYTLSLRDALPISFARAPASAATSCIKRAVPSTPTGVSVLTTVAPRTSAARAAAVRLGSTTRSEEHTSELQSRQYLVCRLLLEKKNNNPQNIVVYS